MRTTLGRQATGQWGEALAARYLTDSGWELLDCNWRCAAGELDIVAREGATIVFCEVKTRSSTAFGDPAAAVVTAKAQRIRRLAVHWLAAHRSHPAAEVRFDVISVVRPRTGPVSLRHLRAAF